MSASTLLYNSIVFFIICRFLPYIVYIKSIDDLVVNFASIVPLQEVHISCRECEFKLR